MTDSDNTSNMLAKEDKEFTHFMITDGICTQNGPQSMDQISLPKGTKLVMIDEKIDPSIDKNGEYVFVEPEGASSCYALRHKVGPLP